jgi:tight adherence protein B
MVITTVVVTCGFGVGLGMCLLLRANKRDEPKGNTNPAVRRSALSGAVLRWPEATIAGVLGISIALITKWPVAGCLSGAIVLGAPSFVRATKRTADVGRTEAIAVWTELLRDTIAAASGLTQAIIATASLAPQAIRPSVSALASRLSSGVPMPEALRMFATDLDDPNADLVVCALLLAASARTNRLVDLLSALSASMREEVGMLLRVEAGRASAKSGVRTIAVFSATIIAVLVVVAKQYLSPFGSADGQLALLMAGACDAVGIALMVRLVRDRAPFRLLTHYVAEETA